MTAKYKSPQRTRGSRVDDSIATCGTQVVVVRPAEQRDCVTVSGLFGRLLALILRRLCEGCARHHRHSGHLHCPVSAMDIEVSHSGSANTAEAGRGRRLLLCRCMTACRRLVLRVAWRNTPKHHNTPNLVPKPLPALLVAIPDREHTDNAMRKAESHQNSWYFELKRRLPACAASHGILLLHGLGHRRGCRTVDQSEGVSLEQEREARLPHRKEGMRRPVGSVLWESCHQTTQLGPRPTALRQETHEVDTKLKSRQTKASSLWGAGLGWAACTPELASCVPDDWRVVPGSVLGNDAQVVAPEEHVAGLVSNDNIACAAKTTCKFKRKIEGCDIGTAADISLMANRHP